MFGDWYIEPMFNLDAKQQQVGPQSRFWCRFGVICISRSRDLRSL